MSRSAKLSHGVRKKTPRRDDLPSISLLYSQAPSHRLYSHHLPSDEEIKYRKRYLLSVEEGESVHIVTVNELSLSHKGSSEPDNQPLYFHPLVHGSAGMLAVTSAYGRGLVSSARFYMVWQLFNVMLGRRLVEFDIPAAFATASFFIAPFLAVDWGVNGYHSSLMLANEYKEERKETRHHQNPLAMISNAFRQNTLAILLGLIGAIGHSFVVHHSVLELEKAYGEHTVMVPFFEILRWFFPVVCGFQYLSTEVPHTAESLKRPLIFEDYSEGMVLKKNGIYQKMGRAERWWRIASMNSAAVVTSLAWGALECTETYLTLRHHLHRNGVALNSEIALLTGLFFGLLGAYNAFIADGERFKSFVTYPYRDPERDKENESIILSLPSRKIPHFSQISYSNKLPLKLLSTGLLSGVSSAGLGVVGATGPLQMVNVFIQFYDPEKPLYASWWLMTISGSVAITAAIVFWITKGRYIYSRWRHHEAKKQLWTQKEWKEHYKEYQDHREIEQDKGDDTQQRNPFKKLKPYYDLHHGALDVLQIGSIFILKLFVELFWNVPLPFIAEISTVYLATLAVGLIPFVCEEVSGTSKPIDMEKAKNIQTLRRVTQCFTQIIIPFAVGVTSEWLLHRWVLNEPVSESSRLTFAHITGTFFAAVSAAFTKRMVDVMFSKPGTYLKWAFFEPPDHKIKAHPLIIQGGIGPYGEYYHWSNFAPFHFFRKITRTEKIREPIGLRSINQIDPFNFY